MATADPSAVAGPPRTATAVLGGGCFWCLEAVYQQLRGVKEVTSGYAGGHSSAPTYREVCSGTTGHAEVVRVVFEPDVISYREILEAFFAIHDPTTPNRQGADTGTQYRSVILYGDDEQREIAEAMIRELGASGRWSDSIVTEVAPLREFHAAERDHWDYYRRNPTQPYCQIVISPKLAKARKDLARLYKEGA
jgi:peptide-methionine (S)-S-oxide reductase